MAEAWHAVAGPLGEPFLRRAVVEVLLLGVLGGVLGAWIVLFGVSYSAESLAHGLFPGLVAAALLGLPLVVGGGGGVALAALAIAGAAGLPGIDRDTSIGVVITSVFGVGVLLALSRSSPPGLGELLFGDVLAVSTTDVAITAAVAAGVLGALALLHGRLLLVGFDRDAARALGVRAGPLEAVLLLLVAAAVVVGVLALGSLLVVAALVAPAAAARTLTHRVPRLMAAGSAIAVACGVGGLELSYHAGTAGGASIALCLVAAYLGAVGAARARHL
jgi:ABC-type Mn2+/Zn2+ transport system permease subunit